MTGEEFAEAQTDEEGNDTPEKLRKLLMEAPREDLIAVLAEQYEMLAGDYSRDEAREMLVDLWVNGCQSISVSSDEELREELWGLSGIEQPWRETEVAQHDPA